MINRVTLPREPTLGHRAYPRGAAQAGIVVSHRSIRRYRWRQPLGGGGQSWRTFLTNELHGIWAADLFVVQTLGSERCTSSSSSATPSAKRPGLIGFDMNPSQPATVAPARLSRAIWPVSATTGLDLVLCCALSTQLGTDRLHPAIRCPSGSNRACCA